MKLFVVIVAMLMFISCVPSNDDDDLYFLSTSGRLIPKKEMPKLVDSTLTADSIIARHIQALGGLDAIKKTRMLHEVDITVDNGDTTFSDSWFEFVVKARSFVKVKDTRYNCYVTRNSAFMTSMKPGSSNGYSVDKIRTSKHCLANLYGRNYYAMPGLLVDYAAKGFSVARVDGPDLGMYELVVILPDTRIFNLHIDPTTFMVKTSTLRFTTAPPEQIDYVMSYSDFTITDDGYQYPREQYWVNGWGEGQSHSDSTLRGWNVLTDYNPRIPDTIFRVDQYALAEYKRLSGDTLFPVSLYESSHQFYPTADYFRANPKCK
jgi:hypothetical protein